MKFNSFKYVPYGMELKSTLFLYPLFIISLYCWGSLKKKKRKERFYAITVVTTSSWPLWIALSNCCYWSRMLWVLSCQHHMDAWSTGHSHSCDLVGFLALSSIWTPTTSDSHKQTSAFFWQRKFCLMLRV